LIGAALVVLLALPALLSVVVSIPALRCWLLPLLLVGLLVLVLAQLLRLRPRLLPRLLLLLIVVPLLA
jgi:hypothetical protein